MRRALLIIALLPIAGYLAWDQVEQHALAREIAAIAARGEPITIDDGPVGADTPERHDAARIYAAAVQRVRGMPNELTFRLSRLDIDTIVPPPLDPVELQKTYRPDAPALQLLDQATPLDFNGFGDVAPDLTNDSPLLTLHSLAALRADLLSATGHADAAAAALVPCIRLWRTGSAFTRYQMSVRLLGSFRILIRHGAPSEPALAALQRAIEELPERDDTAADVMKRRASFIDEFRSPRGSVADVILFRILRPWIAHESRRELEPFAEAIAAAREPWPDRFVSAQRLQEKYSESFRGAARRPWYSRLTPPHGLGVAGLGASIAGREFSARRVMVTTLALERYRAAHGQPPAALAALVPAYLASIPADPFSGAPLVYTRTATEYAIYSVDANGRDDGGALYGFGSKGQLAPRQGGGYDLGIRAPLDAPRSAR